MKRRFNLYIILLFWHSGIALSQDLITGRIIDAQTKEGIRDAQIMTTGRKILAVSDAQGKFSVTDAATIDTLFISSPGYISKKIPVERRTGLLIQLEPDIVNIQEVVVTAGKTQQARSEAPVAIHTISPKMIEETKPVLLAEIMNKVPGVVMLNLNNEQHGMSIRQPLGYSAYYLYMEDGIPLRPPGVFNHNALIEMNMLAISSVEVVKGPVSSLYGSEAIGGAVNFITHRPTAVPTARVGVQMDNFGYSRLQFGAGNFITKKLGFYAGGYMAMQRDGWQTFSDYDKISLNFRADYFIDGKTQLTWSSTTNDYDSQMGGSVDSTAYYERKYISLTHFAYRRVKAVRSRITLQRSWTEMNETSITAFYRKNTIAQFPSYAIRRIQSDPARAHGEINDNSFYSFGMIAQHNSKFNFLNSRLISGLSQDYSPNTHWAHYVSLDRDPASGIFTGYTPFPDSLLIDYSARILNSAAYTQYEFYPVKKIKVVAGMRYDRIDFRFDNHLPPSAFSGAPDETNGFNNLSPRLGATYDSGKDKGAYLNYSRGFSPPTINQMYRGVKVPDLKPAYFDNYETGGWAYFLNKKIYADMSIYQMNGVNEIINYLLPDNSRENRNSGRTMHRGIEYSLNWSPQKQISFRFGGTNSIHKFVRHETREGLNFDGKEMPNAPRWIANTEITYRPAYFPGFRVALEWQRLSSYYTDNANLFRYDDRTLFGLKGVSVMNFRTGYTFKGIELFANVMNISNELYSNIVVRGNFGDNFTPAAPRLVSFGMMYNFSGKENEK